MRGGVVLSPFLPPPRWSSSIACCWPWVISLVYRSGLLFRGPFCVCFVCVCVCVCVCVYIYIYIYIYIHIHIYNFKHRVLKNFYVFKDSDFVLCCVILFCVLFSFVLMLIGTFFLVLYNNLWISTGLNEVQRWSGISHTLWMLIFNIKCTYVELHDWKWQTEDLENNPAESQIFYYKNNKDCTGREAE